MQTTNPFDELKTAESQLEHYEPSNDPNLGYNHLMALLAQERVLDHCRTPMFEQNEHDSRLANDYVFREQMVRHKISEFALKLGQEVTNRIIGEDPAQRSVVAMCIKNRELYPKPVKS